MSRFEGLEFEEKPQVRRKRSAGVRKKRTGTQIRDAAYFQRAAEEDFRAGRLEPALRNFARALEKSNKMVQCWLGQARILIEMEEYAEADLWADRALELLPEHPELLAAKAIALARSGQLERARVYSDDAMSKKAATPFVWLARGEVMLARRSKWAEYCFSKALSGCKAEESRAWMRVDMARVLRRYHRFSQALYHVSTAAQKLARYAMVWLELGLCQAALGLKGAPRSLEQALQLNPACREAQQALAQFQSRGIPQLIKELFRRLSGR